MSVCLSASTSIDLYVYLSIRLSICLSISPSVRLSICPTVCPSARLSICRLSVCLSVCPFVFLSLRLSVAPSVWLLLSIHVLNRWIAKLFYKRYHKIDNAVKFTAVFFNNHDGRCVLKQLGSLYVKTSNNIVKIRGRFFYIRSSDCTIHTTHYTWVDNK